MENVASLDKAAIMAVLDSVPDPEIPVLSILDLGIVRGIAENPPRVMTADLYWMPPTIAIETAIRHALDEAGWPDVHVERVLFPVGALTDHGTWPRAPSRLWDCPAERGRHRHLPAVRLDRTVR